VTNELQRTAYHEAAHALICRQLDRPIDSVSLAPCGNGLAASGVPLAGDRSPEEIEAGLVIVFAGSFAERYAPTLVASAGNGHSEADPIWLEVGELAALSHIAEAAEGPTDSEFIDRFGEEIGPEAVERAQTLAEELIEREAAIGRLALLAAKLLERSHLSGDEIELILKEAAA
jgi:hypothetical protein